MSCTQINTRSCFILLTILILWVLPSQSDSPEWGYFPKNRNNRAGEELGVEFWKDGEGYEACGGDRQSPINIEDSKTEQNGGIDLDFANTDSDYNAVLKNNGHTVKLTFLGRNQPSISGPIFDNATYLLSHLHFHWGSNDNVGSEHWIDGRPFSGEIHLVYYKSSYGSMQNAAKEDDGLAVLGVLLSATQDKDENLDQLIEGVKGVQSYNDTFSLPDQMKLEYFLPRRINEFYTYSGSLTTPPCTENVSWIVFIEPLVVDRRFFDALRDIQDEFDEPLIQNYRPYQPLNDRTVTKFSTDNPGNLYGSDMLFADNPLLDVNRLAGI